MLLDNLQELGIPTHIIGGSIPERLEKITETFGLPTCMSISEAISRAEEDYAKIDTTPESARVQVGS
jgi:hypothetical protein